MLESINHAEGFINGTAERHVVDDLVTDNAFLVDQEETTVCNQFTFDVRIAIVVDAFLASKDIIIRSDRFVDVSNEREGYALDATLVSRSVYPCPVREFTVRGATDNNGVALANSGRAFWKPTISVGQTKVKSFG